MTDSFQFYLGCRQRGHSRGALSPLQLPSCSHLRPTTEGSGQAAGSLVHSTLVKPPTPSHIPTSGVHTEDSCSWAGPQPGRGAGSLLQAPPSLLTRPRGRPPLLSPRDGEEKSHLPPGHPARQAGVSPAPAPTPPPGLQPAPRPWEGGALQPGAPGGAWEPTALTRGPAGWGAPPHARAASPPSLYRVTGAGGRQPSSVLRICSSGAGLALCSGHFSPLCGSRGTLGAPGPQVSPAPAAVGSARWSPSLGSLQGSGRPGWRWSSGAPCVCQVGSGGRPVALLNMFRVLPPRVWAGRPGGAGAAMALAGRSAKPRSSCPAGPGPQRPCEDAVGAAG